MHIKLSTTLFLLNFFILTQGGLFAETLRFPVVRDTWVSSASGEQEGNNGAAPRLKVKGYQEFSIVDFDLASVKGRPIERAILHVKTAGDERLYRVGVSTISADWNEGTGRSYDRQEGGSSFRWRANVSQPWADSGEYSDITSVMFGEGGTIWSHADASEPVDGWQSVEIDPKLVAARLAGISYGFVLFDDTGTELLRDGEEVAIRLFPNRFLYSGDQNAASAPWLELQLADVDVKPAIPAKPSNITVQNKGLPPGEAILQWDVAPLATNDVLGFFVSLNGRDAARSSIPVPSFGDVSRPQTLTMPLRHCGFAPGETVRAEVRAVNRRGVVSQPATLSFRVSDEPLMKLPGQNAVLQRGNDVALPKLGPFAVSVLDEQDKVSADGRLIPERSPSYMAVNHVWNASQKQVRLYAAKNEWLGFQVHFDAMQNADQKGEVTATFSGFENDGDDCAIQFYRFAYVDSPAGKIADPIFPLGSDALAISGRDTIYCELFVPAETSPGERRGIVTLKSADGETLQLNVALTVWDFALPDTLGFLPEMNCYGLPANELEYYRLAQLHRTYINRVPYSHRGTISGGCAPAWDAVTKTFDWSAWDRRYAGLFDGSAFADLPRGAVPVEAFYLPLFENFPANIFEHYNGSDWADEAFSAEYENEFKAGCREFARHFAARGWDETCFHFFLNNKVDYKRNGWSRGSSPWLLDEPASYKDFVALRHFGQMFLEATRDIDTTIRYRCDISRPQWQRDSLDGIMQVNVVGGAFRAYRQMVLDRKERFSQFVYVYGTTCPPEDGAIQPVAWTWDAWTQGADGIVPWQTVGNDRSWETSDALSLFYPRRSDGEGVAPSHRLKSYRRGQQDVEYLIRLMAATGRPRWDVAQAVLAELNLDSEHVVTYSEDAGTQRFTHCGPEDFWQLRMRIGEFLDGNGK